LNETADAGGVPRGPLLFILLTVLINMVGFGLIIPVLPQLVAELGHMDTSEAAGIGGLLVMTYALMQFLFSPILGSLSDAFGRRLVLLLSLAGFAISMLVVGIAEQLWLVFVARALGGATAGGIAAINAYIADIAPPTKRAQTFGLVGVTFGIGFVLGPALGGIVGALSPRAPFFAAAALAVIDIAIGFFLLPESLPRARRRPFSWRRANVLGSLLMLRNLEGSLRRFASIYFIWHMSVQVLYSIWSYIAAYRYHWEAFSIGLSIAYIGVMIALTNGLLVRHSVRWFGEWRTSIIGACGGIAANCMFFFADTPSLVYVGLTINAIGGLTIPALQAMMTSRTAPDRQGELQGMLATLQSLTIIIGPPAFAWLFTRFSGKGAIAELPGMPFALAALLALATAWMLWRVPHMRRV